MGNLFCCIQVDQSTLAFKERFGKIEEVLEPGCHFVPWILGYHLGGKLSLRLQQMDVSCVTITKERLVVEVIASVQYRALADKAIDAFYKFRISGELTQANFFHRFRNPIEADLIHVIEASIAKLNLDDVFERNNEIAKAVEDELKKPMSDYGYEIVHTLIVDVQPTELFKRNMFEITSNKMTEAEKILQIKRAGGEADSKNLSGLSIARQPQVTVDDLKYSVHGFPVVTVKDVTDVTQHFDTMREICTASNYSAVFIPHGPAAIRDHPNIDALIQEPIHATPLSENNL